MLHLLLEGSQLHVQSMFLLRGCMLCTCQLLPQPLGLLHFRLPSGLLMLSQHYAKSRAAAAKDCVHGSSKPCNALAERLHDFLR